MKKTLLAALAMVSSSVQAVEVEVSFHYPDTFAVTHETEMARYIIGFYHQLNSANTIYANNDVDVQLQPAYIHGVTLFYTGEWNLDNDYGELTTNVEALNIAKEYTHDQTPHTDIHVAMTLDTGTLGNASANTESDYELGYDASGDRRAIGIADRILLSTYHAYHSVLAHEIGHVFGLKHTASQAQFFWSSEEDQIGYPTVCADGTNTLMYETATNREVDEVKISGAESCGVDSTADSVTFLNKYAPQLAAVVDNHNVNTLVLNVNEDTNYETYAFEVVRSLNIDEADTGKIYIAGGETNTTDNTNLAPIEFEFEAGSDTSNTVYVDFETLHTMFEIADDSDLSTYAVAVTQTETQDNYVDLLDYNTVWESDEDDEPVDETPSTGSKSSGGSTGFSFILLMLITLILHKRI